MIKNFTEIECELDKGVLFQLCMMAHNKNITLNQLINDILEEAINKIEEKE